MCYIKFFFHNAFCILSFWYYQHNFAVLKNETHCCWRRRKDAHFDLSEFLNSMKKKSEKRRKKAVLRYEIKPFSSGALLCRSRLSGFAEKAYFFELCGMGERSLFFVWGFKIRLEKPWKAFDCECIRRSLLQRHTTLSRAGLAQSVERQALNLMVEGSSPSFGDSFGKKPSTTVVASS